jgi:phosphohistidine swiveling domain-containing protein
MSQAPPYVVGFADAAASPPSATGVKASTLARLSAAGFPVPPGFVITSAAWTHPDAMRSELQAFLEHPDFASVERFAVRSSAVAEDLPGASFAGQYETFLQVLKTDVPDAVTRCADAAMSDRVASYAGARRGVPSEQAAIAVLVQPMVPAVAAGVAFTANPTTGDRAETVVTAVRGLGERLVGGEAVGDEWIVRAGQVTATRSVEHAITSEDASVVAALGRRVEQLLGDPQDIEWALDDTGHVTLLQARPMTALPPDVEWPVPGPGLWLRNFRLGEWLPDPMTPLFADWLLPTIENGYLDGMRSSAGTVVPFRYTSVNGWYFNAVPIPSARLLLGAVAESRGKVLPVLFNALVRVGRNPAAADRAVLGDLYRQWLDIELPAYRRLVEDGERRVAAGADGELAEVIDQVGSAAGRQLWYLAIVGGSAWKMEARLTAFAHQHLGRLLTDGPLRDGVQVLLRRTDVAAGAAAHAVLSIDWFWPTSQELPGDDGRLDEQRRRTMQAERVAAEDACLQELALKPRLQRSFVELLEVARRYAGIREDQARALTIGWPLLRAGVLRLGEHLVGSGVIREPRDVFFLRRDELESRSALDDVAAERESEWRGRRRLRAPLTLGQPPRLVGDPIQRAAERARGGRVLPAGAILGQPVSAGRATGPVRLVTDPDQFDDFLPGEILLARATAPAWTPLFARAAAVITDGGTVAAHASIVAREYGIPAVVGTGDATLRLTTGQWVAVDGSAGTVLPIRTP